MNIIIEVIRPVKDMLVSKRFSVPDLSDFTKIYKIIE